MPRKKAGIDQKNVVESPCLKVYLTCREEASYQGLFVPSQVSGSRSVMVKPGRSSEGVKTSLVQNISTLVQSSLTPEH